MQGKVINTLGLDRSEIRACLGSTYAKYGKANSPCGLVTGWKYSHYLRVWAGALQTGNQGVRSQTTYTGWVERRSLCSRMLPYLDICLQPLYSALCSTGWLKRFFLVVSTSGSSWEGREERERGGQSLYSFTPSSTLPLDRKSLLLTRSQILHDCTPGF